MIHRDRQPEPETPCFGLSFADFHEAYRAISDERRALLSAALRGDPSALEWMWLYRRRRISLEERSGP